MFPNRNRGFGRRPNLVFSVFMIGAGILLFLANLDLLPIGVGEVWQLWPLIFVAIGIGKVTRTRSFSALVLGGLLALFGAIFTLVNLHIIRVHLHDDSWPLSLLFLALGIGGLAKVMEGGKPRFRTSMSPDQETVPPTEGPAEPWAQRENWAGWSKGTTLDDASLLDNLALMASIRRTVETPDFQGGTLTAVWGSIELDLRRSNLTQGPNAVVLETNTVMGSIKLRVPETWRVAWNGTSIMGSFEDKLVPPNTGTAAPQLILTGYILMGQVEVES